MDKDIITMEVDGNKVVFVAESTNEHPSGTLRQVNQPPLPLTSVWTARCAVAKYSLKKYLFFEYNGHDEFTKFTRYLRIRILISEESPDTDVDQESLYPVESSGCHTKLSSLLSPSSVFKSRAYCSCHQLILRLR
ncbi:hypothetical protein OSB04_005724 [Centaurea solstitialis]|uniref:Uncharacterized protein n=1 Tax=Centaurea solstitialis TaxID=347529 RepID=A0AA38TGL8_9ASTR|nr:hypothetical protein OSB04_005724 [Centaurea solstitialis]